MPRNAITGKITRKTVRKPTVRTSVAKARIAKSPQDTAANAVSTALANVSRVVIVNFAGNPQTYSYHTRDESIQVGDYCLVISPIQDHKRGSWRIQNLNGFLTIVKVVDVKETTHSINMASKWIVGKLDITSALAEAERQEQLAVLKAKIDKARKAAEERVKLEQLRELSPELDSLITAYDALSVR